MRLISYRHEGEAGVGVMVDDTGFVALNNAAPDLTRCLREILGQDGWAARIEEAVEGKPADLSIADVVIDPVIPEPQAIWALALNFKLHIEETGLTTSTEHPQIFLRMPCSQVGHLQNMECPRGDISNMFDYEGELAVIIGEGGRYISEQDALSKVAGYACYNEGSVREFQRHNRQFGLGKNFENSGALGPWMMTGDEFGNPADQTVITRLNGVEKQKSGLDDMLFPVEQVIQYLSTGYSLRPGDVIVMGTPGALKPGPDYVAGPNDSDRIPGRTHMKPGDTVEVEITGLGVLKNPITQSD